MKEETIEDKVRKIQSLFLDQIEVRLFTDTEIDHEAMPKIKWIYMEKK